MSSPTKRSLARLRAQGYLPAVVEKWNQHGGAVRDGKRVGIRQDLYGFIDVVAIRSDRTGVLAIQATSRGHIGDRLRKIQDIVAAREWLAAGNRLQIHGWSKVAGKWCVKVREVALEEITAAPVVVA